MLVTAAFLAALITSSSLAHARSVVVLCNETEMKVAQIANMDSITVKKGQVFNNPINFDSGNLVVSWATSDSVFSDRIIVTYWIKEIGESVRAYLDPACVTPLAMLLPRSKLEQTISSKLVELKRNSANRDEQGATFESVSADQIELRYACNIYIKRFGIKNFKKIKAIAGFQRYLKTSDEFKWKCSADHMMCRDPLPD